MNFCSISASSYMDAHPLKCGCSFCVPWSRVRELATGRTRNPQFLEAATSRVRILYTQLLDLADGVATAPEIPGVVLSDFTPPPGGVVALGRGASSVPPRAPETRGGARPEEGPHTTRTPPKASTLPPLPPPKHPPPLAALSSTPGVGAPILLGAAPTRPLHPDLAPEVRRRPLQEKPAGKREKKEKTSTPRSREKRRRSSSSPRPRGHKEKKRRSRSPSRRRIPVKDEPSSSPARPKSAGPRAPAVAADSVVPDRERLLLGLHPIVLGGKGQYRLAGEDSKPLQAWLGEQSRPRGWKSERGTKLSLQGGKLKGDPRESADQESLPGVEEVGGDQWTAPKRRRPAAAQPPRVGRRRPAAAVGAVAWTSGASAKVEDFEAGKTVILEGTYFEGAAELCAIVREGEIPGGAKLGDQELGPLTVPFRCEWQVNLGPPLQSAVWKLGMEGQLDSWKAGCQT